MQTKKNGLLLFFFPDDFGLRSLRRLETIFAKKRYTSIVALVSDGVGGHMAHAMVEGAPFFFPCMVLGLTLL